MNNDNLYCPNCGKKTEDGSNFCSACGHNFNADNETDSVLNNVPEDSFKQIIIKEFKKLKNSRIFKIVFAILLALIVILMFSSNTLSEYEKTALEDTEYLIDHMKDPDSFKLQSDIVCLKVVSDMEDYNGKEIYYIEYSAKNGFGGTTTSVACFFNGSYVDLDDSSINNIDKDDYGSVEDYLAVAENELKRYGKVRTLNSFYYEWENLGSESTSIENAEIISAKKIAKKADCDYSK